MAPENNVDEVTRYLSTGPEDVANQDVLTWWYEHQHVYPNLSRMALDYHTVPSKSHFHSSLVVYLRFYCTHR